jgi:hypothetical protein
VGFAPPASEAETNRVCLTARSRLCEDIDVRVKAFLERPIEGDWPYLWIDATYIKVRQNGRIVSVVPAWNRSPAYAMQPSSACPWQPDSPARPKIKTTTLVSYTTRWAAIGCSPAWQIKHSASIIAKICPSTSR